MSSLFELADRVRRLRETLSYARGLTQADAAALRTGADERAREEWRLFLAELGDYAALAETLASPTKRRAKRPRPPPLLRSPAASSGATLH